MILGDLITFISSPPLSIKQKLRPRVYDHCTSDIHMLVVGLSFLYQRKCKIRKSNYALKNIITKLACLNSKKWTVALWGAEEPQVAYIRNTFLLKNGDTGKN